MNSYRRIFKSSAIIGGASVINILIGITKVKVLAVLLGPAGVGLMGVFQNLVSMASTVAALGVGNSGVRQIAASAEDIETLSIVRRALWYGNLFLGATGMLALWALREPVATLVFGDSSYVNEVAWLGLGVMLTLIAGSQTALLQGLRRIGDLAKVKIGSALVAAVVGIVLVYSLGERGVLWFVIAAPAGSVLVAAYYARKLPKPASSSDWAAIREQWQAMVKLGIPFMGAGLLTLATQLAVRSMILENLGLEATGYFQAAWTISMTYIGFVLGAMGADFYPRLTAVITDHAAARKLVNEQTEMSLLMAAPVLFAMLAFAPLVIELLYSAKFAPAADLLRWQMLGDALKVASWPMAFIFLARGRGQTYLLIQLVWNVVFYAAVILALNTIGLEIVGVAYVLAYFLCFIFVGIFVWTQIKFVLSARNTVFLLHTLFGCAVLILVNNISQLAGLWIGVSAVILFSGYSLYRLNKILGIRLWIKRKLKR